MLSKIVVTSDGSEASDRVVECVRGLARVGTRRVTLAHVFNVRDVGGLYSSLQQFLLPKLEQQAAALREAGFETDIQTPLGFPAHEIQRIARETDASIIVTGSRGASLLNEVVLGSTASSLLHSAQLPVLLIRIEMILENGGRRCRAACGNLFDKILFPTDCSDNAEHALLYLEHLTREARSQVVLLHVQDQAKIERHLKHRLDEFNRIDAGRLDAIRLRLEQAGTEQVTAEIPFGNPTQIILDRARSGDFSLIVMGCQGRGFLHEIFLGSVANQVARLAPLPVLFVPAVR